MDLSRKKQKVQSVFLPIHPSRKKQNIKIPLNSDLSEVLIRIGVEQTALSGRDLSLEDDPLTGANQDGPCAGLITKQLVPAYALD